MATGVRSSDIIATIWGARHRGKMQEVQGLQYVGQRDAAKAKAEAEASDRLFSRGLEVAKTFTPETREAAMTNPLMGVKPPTEGERKSSEEKISRQQFADFLGTDAGNEVIKQLQTANPQLNISREGLIQAAGQLGEDKFFELVDSIGKQSSEKQRIDIARQNSNRLSAAKEKPAPEWQVKAFFGSDEYASKLAEQRDDLQSKLDGYKVRLRSPNLSPDDSFVISKLVESTSKRMKEVERKISKQYGKFVASKESQMSYELDSETLNENIDLLFPELK